MRYSVCIIKLYVLILSLVGLDIDNVQYISLGVREVCNKVEYICGTSNYCGQCEFFIENDVSEVGDIVPVIIILYWGFFMIGLSSCVINSRGRIWLIAERFNIYLNILIFLNIGFHIVGLSMIYIYDREMYRIVGVPGLHTLYLGYGVLLMVTMFSSVFYIIIRFVYEIFCARHEEF